MAIPTPPAPPPLPPNLPVPEDDGLAAHLVGRILPDAAFEATAIGSVDLRSLARRKLVLYVYPGMGPPDGADPEGWDDIPGARGCTQQSCSFRDHSDRFRELGYELAGLSAQSSTEQEEAMRRLQLSFPLLADSARQLGAVLDLPTFEVEGRTYYKRLTLIAHDARIVKVFYPVFPPQKNPEEVLTWVIQNDVPV